MNPFPDASAPGDDWWDELFPDTPHPKPPGATEMLRLIVYDIGSPRRLRRIANVCEDFGIRVQKSVFECWLDKDRFEALWDALLAEIETDSDSLVAYTLDSAAARQRRVAGMKTAITGKRTRLIL